jgi:hypothetical protein
MAKKKSYGFHAPTTCGGAYACEFTDESLPFLRCEKCNHQVEDWIKWEKQYKNMWQEDAHWSEVKNNVVVILGYFCHKFRTQYKSEFNLSYTDSGLFRGTEAIFVRRLLAMFSGSTLQVKEYLDWYFDYKVVQQGKKLVSMTALVAPAVVGLYKHQAAKKNVITRSTPLPEKMISWVKEHIPTLTEKSDLKDFGDLQQMLTYHKKNPGKISEIEALVQELYRRKLIDNELNIQGIQ